MRGILGGRGGQEVSPEQNGVEQGNTQPYAAPQMATRGQKWPHQKDQKKKKKHQKTPHNFASLLLGGCGRKADFTGKCKKKG